MADRAVLEATTRTVVGKRVKRLRKTGRIPATIYGHKIDSESIDVDARQFRVVHRGAGDNQLVDLVIDGKGARPVLIHTLQIDPRRNTAMHIEFFQANLREKLTAHVPIHVTGESPATKRGMMVLTLLDSIEVECLPTDIPVGIDVDISGLEEAGAAIYVRDLALDRNSVAVKTDGDELVLHVTMAYAAEEEAVEAAEAPAQPTEAASEDESSG